MNSNNSNPSKGCMNWVKGLGGAFLGLLTAAASCAGIMQYLASMNTTPTQPANSNYVASTSVPVSNVSNPSNAQADVVNVSTTEWQAVATFLQNAVTAEITAYQYGDASYASMYYGDALQTLQSQISDLNARGIYVEEHFDSNKSYIHAIREPNNSHIEVDSCEYWASDYYDRQTGTLISSDAWKLVPQTILIEYIDNNFYITSVAFYTGQAFCS